MRVLQRVVALSLTWGIAVLEQIRINLENWLKTIRFYNQRLEPGCGDRTGDSAIHGERPRDCVQSVINGIEDEVMIIAPDFSIKQVNKAMLRRLGTSAVEVVGLPCYRVTHGAEEPCQPPWCECPLRSVLETGQSSRIVHSCRESGVDESSERWVEKLTSPIWDGSGHITEVIELMRDVSENKRLQRELLKASRNLLALNSIAKALSQSLDLEVTLQAVAETMLEALEAQVSWVKLLGDTSGTPTAQASCGLSPEALDELMEAISNVGATELTATSVSYSVVPSNGTERHDQTLWQITIAPLKSKGVVLGMAGIAAAKRPVDQQRIQLLDAIGNQIAVAVERCTLYEEVQCARDVRGYLLRDIITTQEEERKRIARELHDETGQALTALRLCLERLALAPASGAEEFKARLAQPLSLCQQAEEEVDKLIFDLRPALLDDLGLLEAVKYYAETRLRAAGIEVSFRITGKERRPESEREAALFRVIQESITNIVKHAHAKSVVIHLQFQSGQLVALVEDDGCGFETRQAMSPRNSRQGLGLIGMRERMGLAGGSLGITSKSGVGTCVKATVPLAGEGI